MLEQLCRYAERLDLPPPAYQKTRIRWLIDLDSVGRLVGDGFLRTVDESDKRQRGKEYLAPHVMRTVRIGAKLLADRADYALGLTRDAAQQERTAQCHREFAELVGECAAATGEPSVQAVLAFLSDLDPEALSAPEDLTGSDVVTFRVGDVIPIDLPSVRAFWAARQVGGEGGYQCLVCGRPRPVLQRHTIKIKGIPGGQTSGMALISANVPAFQSYGLEESLIAPVCQECAERYANALNALIADSHTRVRVGDIVYVFWTREDRPFSISTLLSAPEPEDVQALIESASRGREAAVNLDPTPFYAMALSASGGRVVVRDWLESTVGEVQRNLARYFNLQRIADWDGAAARPFGIFPLAASLVQNASRDMPPNAPKVLLRMALNGGPLPDWMLFQAVKRARAEQGLTRPRAAVIKMALLSNQPNSGEDSMTQLDSDNHDAAYLCGRLLAILENAQESAVHPKATIVDRYYGTASSAPATVFPTLMRGVQAHLGKLRKENEPAYHALQQRLEEVASNLVTFPAVFTLREQGLFALGYYHQRAADHAQRRAHAQAKGHKQTDSAADAAQTPEGREP